MNSTSPASLFGGTWEQIKDVFLLGAGDSYIAGSTGGEENHILTVDEMPSHAGHLYGSAGSNNYGNATGAWLKSIQTSDYSVAYGWDYSRNEYYPANHPTGVDQPHNNMPTYLAVYMWKRIS